MSGNQAPATQTGQFGPGESPEDVIAQARRRTFRRLLRNAAVLAPGLMTCLLVAAAATTLGRIVRFGSGPVLAIALGLLVGSLIGPRDILRPGIGVSSSVLLRAAVVILGAELPIAAVLSQGIRSLPAIVVTLGGCMLVSVVVGRRMGIGNPLRTLIGVGTGICGASAIAAVAPVVKADEMNVGYAVATIFFFNIAAVFSFPPLGHALGMSQQVFGVFAGTAVNDLSSVIAVGDVYGPHALDVGVIVKLTRTLMIVPICIALSSLYNVGGPEEVAVAASSGPGRLGRVVRAVADTPRFLLGFLALTAIASTHIIPPDLTQSISGIATLMITVALAAVGLSIDLSTLRRTGLRPVAFGAALWITVSLLSLGTQAVGL